ncbi:Uncharacterised protein [Salmonella enterica subsp. enterica serovar Typhi]|nr:Uncharacterised protein [Salmonella enterica subsp. enterica serovar Typhi]CQY36901.1 Uncharacterised protein [Salmonella enterica subsp. enterica serovar Typhi]CQY66521.1 Uncharacterised protein [Salmonella enterica subsp. enterica serovar Typhi]CRA20519.1 Uncharacterised protein [Salmonella enterica subsp. enterica serovar Typhi]CRA50639.1 Uncharacterised protein [Salmonella enterica subsp. enterica serovar Typhi]
MLRVLSRPPNGTLPTTWSNESLGVLIASCSNGEICTLSSGCNSWFIRPETLLISVAVITVPTGFVSLKTPVPADGSRVLPTSAP